jgi:hypothetical protein
MNKNTKRTSNQVASLAATTLSSEGSSQIAKVLAASSLSQSGTSRQTGTEMEKLASRVLISEKYSVSTKKLAASVLSQANKAR